MLGYVSPVLNPVSKRTQFLNTIRGICGTNKPVACWLPDTGDGRTSVDPISGRLWTAETLTNLITNGGFETNTTGWTTGGTNSIASSTTQFFFGSHSCLFTYSNNATYASYAITVAAAGTYQFSISIFIPSNFDGQGIQLTDSGSFAGGTITTVNADMTKTNQWQRLTCQMVIVGGDLAGTLVVLGTGTAPTATRTLFFDGAQMELSAYPTGYIETNGGTATTTAPIGAKGFGQGGLRVFDGATNFLSTPDTADLSFVEPKTSSWFTVANVTSTANVRTIISKLDSGQAEWMFQVLGTTNVIRLFLTNPAVTLQSIIPSTSAISLGAMHSYGATYNGTIANPPTGGLIYQDGASIGTTPANVGTYAGMTDGTSTVEIGSQTLASANFFQGTIAMVLVVNALLTAAQTLALHNAARQYFQF